MSLIDVQSCVVPDLPVFCASHIILSVPKISGGICHDLSMSSLYAVAHLW